MPKRVLRTTKINVNEIGIDEDTLLKLEHLYIEFENQSRNAVEEQRKAASAQADANVALAHAQKALMGFLTEVSKHNSTVACEPYWLRPYRNEKGQMILESPFTMKDQRAAARAMHRQISAINKEDPEEYDDIFGEEEQN